MFAQIITHLAKYFCIVLSCGHSFTSSNPQPIGTPYYCTIHESSVTVTSCEERTTM